MKNVGPRYGGSITAAQFLQRFVEKGVTWAHLDIAGMVWADKAGRDLGQGRDRLSACGCSTGSCVPRWRDDRRCRLRR